MKVRKVEGDFAQVESGRLLRRVNIQMLPRVQRGDYLIVHAGFAIERLDPEKAKQTLRLIDALP
jgi:hydrogenase expression/formation protein HypC